MKPGFVSIPFALMEMTGICAISGFFECAADKSDVVRRTAAASGLAHEDGRVVEIILSGQQGIHDLSDDDQGRVAGVIVYIF